MQDPVIVGVPVDYRDNHRLMENDADVTFAAANPDVSNRNISLFMEPPDCSKMGGH
jgi:hypothetical protein